MTSSQNDAVGAVSAPSHVTWRSLMRIAVPMMAASAVRYFVDASNFFWTGKLGVTELSIASALSYYLWIPQSLGILTNVGTASFVARYRGKGDETQAAHLGLFATELAFVLGIFVASLSFVFHDRVLHLCRVPSSAWTEAELFFLLQLCAVPFAFAQTTVSAALVGLDDPKGSFGVNAVGVAVTGLLTPLLIFPLRFGLAGAALANAAGYAASAAYGLFRGTQVAGDSGWAFRALFGRWSKSALRGVAPVLRVGVPLMADALFHGVISFAMVALIARYGRSYVAGLGTEEKVTFIFNLPAEGLSRAAVVLVGFHLGRGDRAAAKASVAKSLLAVLAGASFGVTATLLWPRGLIGVFSDDQHYVAVGSTLLRIAAAGLVFLGIRDVMDSCFGGMGNTTPPLVVGVIGAAARLPIAYLLADSFGMGGYGVAWAFTITLIFQGIALPTWFFARFRTDVPGR